MEARQNNRRKAVLFQLTFPAAAAALLVAPRARPATGFLLLSSGAGFSAAASQKSHRPSIPMLPSPHVSHWGAHNLR